MIDFAHVGTAGNYTGRLTAATDNRRFGKDCVAQYAANEVLVNIDRNELPPEFLDYYDDFNNSMLSSSAPVAMQNNNALTLGTQIKGADASVTQIATARKPKIYNPQCGL